MRGIGFKPLMDCIIIFLILIIDPDFQKIITRLAAIREINTYLGSFPFFKMQRDRLLIHVLIGNLM